LIHYDGLVLELDGFFVVGEDLEAFEELASHVVAFVEVVYGGYDASGELFYFLFISK
jgi:hypothetical protein